METIPFFSNKQFNLFWWTDTIPETAVKKKYATVLLWERCRMKRESFGMPEGGLMRHFTLKHDTHTFELKIKERDGKAKG